MADIKQLLPPERFESTRFFSDVVDLREDEEDGYAGSGTYAVAVSGGRLALHKIDSDIISGVTEAMRKAAQPWFERQLGAQLFFAAGSSYQLMDFRPL